MAQSREQSALAGPVGPQLSPLETAHRGRPICGLAGPATIQMSRVREALEESEVRGKLTKSIPQGLKLTLILRHLWHD